MNPIVVAALVLILAGLAMAWVGPKLTPALLGRVVYWVGVVLIVVGLILLLSPVLFWLNAQLRAMFGP